MHSNNSLELQWILALDGIPLLSDNDKNTVSPLSMVGYFCGTKSLGFQTYSFDAWDSKETNIRNKKKKEIFNFIIPTI